MNKTVYQTIVLALCDYKTYWNKKINSYDKKYGSISNEAKDICLDKIKDITQSLEYLNELYRNESTDSEDEFTASNMRKRIGYKNHEASMIEIDNIKEHIKKQCDICTDYYLYKYSMNEFTSQYFRSRGFKIEHDFKCFDNTYAKISWE